MKFAIRDDDISYFTDPVKLENLYIDIIQDCPISFSCIPFLGGNNDDLNDPETRSKYDKQWLDWISPDEKLIGENEELVNLLRKWCDQGRGTIMMHGVHHDLCEFTQNKNFTDEVKKAKQYLERLFSRDVLVFTPPNNSIGISGVHAIEENNMDIMLSFGHMPNERPYRLDNIINFTRLLKLYLFNGKTRRTLKPLRFKGHKEQGCYDLGPNTKYDEIMDGLKHAARKNGNFVIATRHYHLFDGPELLGQRKSIIQSAKDLTGNKVKFVFAEEIFLENC